MIDTEITALIDLQSSKIKRGTPRLESGQRNRRQNYNFRREKSPKQPPLLGLSSHSGCTREPALSPGPGRTFSPGHVEHLREVRLNYVKGLLGYLCCMNVNPLRGLPPPDGSSTSYVSCPHLGNMCTWRILTIAPPCPALPCPALGWPCPLPDLVPVLTSHTLLCFFL
jgi:hypothetical protein